MHAEAPRTRRDRTRRATMGILRVGRFPPIAHTRPPTLLRQAHVKIQFTILIIRVVSQIGDPMRSENARDDRMDRSDPSEHLSPSALQKTRGSMGFASMFWWSGII